MTLPNIDFGAGCIWETADKYTIFVIRDDKAPRDPSSVDGQYGTVEDETLKEAQYREGTEETVLLKQENNKTVLGIPSCIKDTQFETNLQSYYKTAYSNSDTLPDIEDLFYYNSTIKNPEYLPEIRISDSYVSGYTVNFNSESEISYELTKIHSIDLDSTTLFSDTYQLYDLEYFGADPIHLNRPLLILDQQTGNISVCKSGRIQYEGHITEFKNLLRDTFGWDIGEDVVPATAKVQFYVYSHPNMCSDIKQVLVDQNYITKVKNMKL